MGTKPRRNSNGPVTVGIDIGTTSVKAIAANEEGRVIRQIRLPHDLEITSGRLEHDAEQAWWAAVITSWEKMVSLHPVAVAVAALMPSIAPVDGAGRPIGPGLLYGDRRAARARGDESDPTSSSDTENLVCWSAEHVPEAAAHWPAQAVANAALGAAEGGVVDLGTAVASGTMLNSSGWDADVCASIGTSAQSMPRIVFPGEAIGLVTPAAKRRDPALLGAGSVDGLCEQLVSGVAEDGDVLVVAGSTLLVWVTVPEPSSAQPYEDGLWTIPHTIPGKAMVGGASTAGGLWLEWVERLVAQSNVVDQDPTDVPLWWPWVRGERVPLHDPTLTASLSGVELSHGPSALRQAAYEASAFVVRCIIERVGVPIRRVVMSGGGALKYPWAQAIADCLEVPVLPAAVPQGAALGAAWLARTAAGLEKSMNDAVRWASYAAPLEPRPGWIRPVEDRYGRWLEGLEAQATNRSATHGADPI